MKSSTVQWMAGIAGVLGIAIGAFGAHALPNLLSELTAAELQERIAWLETGSRYHMYHAAALFALAVSSAECMSRLRLAALAWCVGIVVFSGCLYAMAVTGVRGLGAMVPLGGVAFLVGWAAVAWSRPAKSQ